MPEETLAIPQPNTGRLSPRELRPMAQARKIPLIEREIRERLSQAALDVIFAHAQIISEGEGGKGQFFGSTMLTFDIATLAEILREPADEGTARRLAALLAKEESLARRIESVVRREVERIAAAAPQSVRGETRIRAQGTRVFLDVDVEASLG
jgi:hypothetical protein